MTIYLDFLHSLRLCFANPLQKMNAESWMLWMRLKWTEKIFGRMEMCWQLFFHLILRWDDFLVIFCCYHVANFVCEWIFFIVEMVRQTNKEIPCWVVDGWGMWACRKNWIKFNWVSMLWWFSDSGDCWLHVQCSIDWNRESFGSTLLQTFFVFPQNLFTLHNWL